MKSILVKDTTREERAAIVAEAIGNTEGACDGCAPGIVRMYDEYIEGRETGGFFDTGAACLIHRYPL